MRRRRKWHRWGRVNWVFDTQNWGWSITNDLFGCHTIRAWRFYIVVYA